jgi:outer membrane protein TolC
MTSRRRRSVTNRLRADVALRVACLTAIWSVIACALAAPDATAAEQRVPLTLEAAVEAALSRNESALAALERVRAADARVAQARSGFLPDVTLGASYTRATEDLSGSDVGAGRSAGGFGGTATVTVPLFEPRAIPLYRRATLERESATLEAGDTRDLLAFEVAAAFFAALTSEQVLAASERRLQLARATHADARDRAAAGLVSSNDVTRAELELWSAERDLTRARSALEIDRVRLSFLMDAPVAEKLVAPAQLLAAAVEARGEDDAVDPAELERRKDVRALQLRADALRAFADEPRWRLLPSLALTGQLRSVEDDATGRFRSDGVVGATLTWTLWDGGLRAAERRERLALASVGELDQRAAERGTERDLREALSSLRAGQDAERQAQAAAGAAQRNSAESTILYRQGLAPALAVTDASTRLFEAEVDLARARLDLARGFLALRRATGLDPLGRELQ